MSLAACYLFVLPGEHCDLPITPTTSTNLLPSTHSVGRSIVPSSDLHTMERTSSSTDSQSIITPTGTVTETQTALSSVVATTKQTVYTSVVSISGSVSNTVPPRSSSADLTVTGRCTCIHLDTSTNYVVHVQLLNRGMQGYLNCPLLDTNSHFYISSYMQ